MNLVSEYNLTPRPPLHQPYLATGVREGVFPSLRSGEGLGVGIVLCL
jgi:hypothetical protein